MKESELMSDGFQRHKWGSLEVLAKTIHLPTGADLVYAYQKVAGENYTTYLVLTPERWEQQVERLNASYAEYLEDTKNDQLRFTFGKGNNGTGKH